MPGEVSPESMIHYIFEFTHENNMTVIFKCEKITVAMVT